MNTRVTVHAGITVIVEESGSADASVRLPLAAAAMRRIMRVHGRPPFEVRVQAQEALTPAEQLVKRLDGAISLKDAQALDNATLNALNFADPAVVKALLGAGMAIPDVAKLAGGVSAEEAASPIFIAELTRGLKQGLQPEVALAWARGSVRKIEGDPSFLAAVLAGWGDTPERAWHFVQATRLAAQLGVDVQKLLPLTPKQLQALSQRDAAETKALLALGLDPAQVVAATAEQRKGLLAAPAEVVKALLKAGMAVPDVTVNAFMVTEAEAKSADFLKRLGQKLSAGKPALDAIVLARFAGHATDAELGDQDFRRDLLAAIPAKWADTSEQAVVYARAQRLARTLKIDPRDILSLGLEAARALESLNPADVQKLLALGLKLADISGLSAKQAAALLVLDPAELKALIDKGQTPLQVSGLSAIQRQAVLLYGGELTPEELADPDFVKDLLLNSKNWEPATRAERATEMINGLSYLRDHVDLFEAAEQVMLPDTNAHNGWFANAGVDQLARMAPDAPEWAQIEQTLGRAVPMEERTAAIGAARDLTQNWTELCSMAGALNLHLRDDQVTLDFKADELDDIDYAPLIDMLGNEPSADGSLAMNVISALEYARRNVDIFEAAEHVAKPDSDPHNGWFANAGVFKLAELKVDSLEWGQIEATLGRRLSSQERQQAISAAQGLTQNWTLLLERASAIGLDRRPDTPDTIDFRSEGRRYRDDHGSNPRTNPGEWHEVGLPYLKFGPLLDQLKAPHSSDLLQSLRYARAHALERHLADASGQPALGADWERLVKLNLDGQQVGRLLKLDPADVRNLMEPGHALEQIAALSPEQAKALVGMDPVLLGWASGLPGATLAEIAQLDAAQLKQLTDIMNGKATLVQPNQVIAEGDIDGKSVSAPLALGGGLLTFTTKSGEHYLVLSGQNPSLYSRALQARQDSVSADIDKLRKQYNLPSQADVDVASLLGTQPADPSNPDGDKLTVGQATLQNLVDKYRGMLERGEMHEDDPRAQLVRAYEARAALSNGYTLLPYYEDTGNFGGTYRKYPGGEDNPTTYDMTSADVGAILDEGAVNNRILTLMGHPAVQADYQAALNAQLDALPDRKERADALFKALTSDDYLKVLDELKANGNSLEAEQMTQRDLANLAMLDPAKAADAAKRLMFNSLGAEFSLMLDHPEQLKAGDFEQPLQDIIDLVIRGLRGGAAAVRHTSQTIADFIKFANEVRGDKRSVTALSETLRQLVIDNKNGGITSVGDEAFMRAMEKTYVPADLRGRLMGFFTTAQKLGVWGTISGGAALGAFAYKLTKGAWGADSTALERWGAARDVIAFMSVLNHMSKTGASTVDQIKKLFGGKDEDKLWKALGLDSTLPEIWGKKNSVLPGDLNWSDMWDKYFGDEDAFRASQNAQQRAAFDAIESEIFPDGGSKEIKGGWRITSTMIKVLGTVTDLAGVADIVVGALGLKKSIADGDAEGIVSNALGIAGGAALTGAGLIGSAGLLATVPGVLAAASAPLLLVGAVLSISALIVTLIWSSVKRHNQLQNTSDDQSQWFRKLASDGLAQPDWFDKLEYLRYAWSIYGKDNPDNGQSYFDFQQPEWDHFRSTQGEDGSSLNRLDRNLHRFTDLSNESPIAENDDPPTYD